jgi:hypothetical protein
MNWWQWLVRWLDNAGADPVLPDPTTLEYRNAIARAAWTKKYYAIKHELDE